MKFSTVMHWFVQPCTPGAYSFILIAQTIRPHQKRDLRGGGGCQTYAL